MITLYDIGPCKVPGVKGYSAHVRKIIYTLNYKKLPYIIQLVDYLTLEPTAQSLGATPTTKRLDGSPRWTVPFIHDSSSGRTVSDSFAIAEYLETTYPNTPRLFPPGTRGLQAAFCDAVIQKLVASGIVSIARPKMQDLGTEVVKESLRVKYRNTDPSAIPKATEVNQEALWEKGKDIFDRLADGYPALVEGTSPIFVMVTEPVFADFALGGLLWEFMVAFGKDSEEWKKMENWMDGRVGKLVEVLDTIETSEVGQV
ncbi:hypothetical protein E1B28_002883 [Marasmius oreades]|uniref:GST N-terminal domain-containing protein n=1 Tax=Marasmius oreades TaxID=181124 RepID=A0A9P7RNX5_9AGAR|nr:uncharacterized protein E1B28_002883 [Marasmius oreades]KAG7086967.1 hypothetical protein E1B28_002883 [Marasmius oreades]